MCIKYKAQKKQKKVLKICKITKNSLKFINIVINNWSF